MDDFWLKIDEKQFEEISVEYARTNFPNWIWVGTKQTRDGGKDGYAKIFNEQTKIGVIKKEAWVEAKYTKNCNRALPLSRIASTVLIGHNKKDIVQLLLIVTNATFSENTIYEINLALGKHVCLVTGEELKSWLLEDNQKNIRNTYFYNEQIHSDTKDFYLLGNPMVISSDLLCRSISTRTEQLIVGNEYTLFLTLNISIHSSQEYKFKIINHSNLIKIQNDFHLDTRKGTNFISIPFIASKQGVLSKNTPLITFKETSSLNQFEVKIDLKIKSSSNIEIWCKAQNECEHILLNNYNYFCNQDKGVFFNLIEGKAGNGKSYILNDFLKGKKNKDFIFIKFNQKNELSNSSLLIRLLTFIVWGRFFAENILIDNNSKELSDEIKKLHQISGYNKSYTKYLQYLADKNNALETINNLMEESNLLPPISNTTEKIVILDDLQFLGLQTSQFLLNLFKQENLSDYKIFFILTKRDHELLFNELNKFIKIYSSQNPFNVFISEDDVHQSLILNNLYNFPPIIYTKLKQNFFVLKDFIAEASILYNEKTPISIINSENIKKILSNKIQIPFLYLKLGKYEKEVIDIVYFFQTGVESYYLYKNYKDKVIDNLIFENIIKNSSTGYIPYHDLMWESISRIVRYDSEHIFNYAKYKKEKGFIIEYLSVLGYFPSKFDREKKYFMSNLNLLHKKQEYANVYYILHRFFLSCNYEKILSCRYEKALLFFYYAYATFNVGDKNGLELFEKAYNLLDLPQLDQSELSLSNLILSEIANCHYWDLNFESVSNKYKKICNDFFKKSNKKKEDWISYFTISNRYINMLLFKGEYVAAENIYRSIITNNKEIKYLAMHIFIDYNRITFVMNPQNSYTNIKRIIETNFINLPIKNQFIIKSTFLTIGCFLGYNSIEDLEQCIEWGKSNFLEYNYRIAKLDLAICYALVGKFIEMEQTIQSISDIRDFPTLALGKYHNIEAIMYLSKHKYKLALASLNEQERCFEQFGDSYLDKIRYNKRLIQSMPATFVVTYMSDIKDNAFYIEIRL